MCLRVEEPIICGAIRCEKINQQFGKRNSGGVATDMQTQQIHKY